MSKKFKLGPLQKKWIKTLKNHPERQMKHSLGKLLTNGSYKCCCLGQAKIIIETSKGNNYRECFKNSIIIDGGMNCLVNSYTEIGLYSCNGSIRRSSNSLARMNDIGYTWKQIAEFIENNPELVFKESK
jgi:hypothetical protein